MEHMDQMDQNELTVGGRVGWQSRDALRALHGASAGGIMRTEQGGTMHKLHDVVAVKWLAVTAFLLAMVPFAGMPRPAAAQLSLPAFPFTDNGTVTSSSQSGTTLCTADILGTTAPLGGNTGTNGKAFFVTSSSDTAF